MLFRCGSFFLIRPVCPQTPPVNPAAPWWTDAGQEQAPPLALGRKVIRGVGALLPYNGSNWSSIVGALASSWIASSPGDTDLPYTHTHTHTHRVVRLCTSGQNKHWRGNGRGVQMMEWSPPPLPPMPDIFCKYLRFALVPVQRRSPPSPEISIRTGGEALPLRAKSR